MRGREYGGEDRFKRWEAETESREKKADLRDETTGRGGGWESENSDLSLS